MPKKATPRKRRAPARKARAKASARRKPKARARPSAREQPKARTKPAARGPGEISGIGDDAVRARTGKTWAAWFAILDAERAVQMPQRDVAQHLYDEHGVDGWWAQMLAVGYAERVTPARGRALRGAAPRTGRAHTRRGKAPR